MHPALLTANLFELLAAILGTIYYFKYRNTPSQPIVFYLWYVVLNELAAYFLLKNGIIRYQLTNLYSLVTAIFFLLLVYRILEIKNLKKLVLGLIILISVSAGVELMTTGISNAWKFTKTFTAFIGIGGFIIYLIHLFQLKTQKMLFKDLSTYILLGFLVFFIGTPVVNLARILYSHNLELVIRLNYILIGVVILMYSIFSFGFIYSVKQK